MTDKQIINSCEFQSRCIQYKDMYSNKHIKCPIVDFALACRGENKCKYKTVYEQLKAKEQECEFSNLKIIQLQETLSQYETDLSTKDCIVETCKAQYKELKAENETLKSFDINLVGVKECEIRQLVQYRKALAEIKEIVKEQLPTVNYNFAKSMHPEMFNCYEQILQKISECEV